MKVTVARQPDELTQEVWSATLSNDFVLTFHTFAVWQRPFESGTYQCEKIHKLMPDLFEDVEPLPEVPEWAIEDARNYIISQISIA